ncbi:transposase [Iodobacter sp. CM08]|uniref:transposase n=1 Tax=Iodobacter sp. CM08 TaxID=3085902 RepID=UPI002980BE53|nr:transposase [Iodobacter sp. CM08]MDW5416636.1 transposase [Iodobacter sp. CM08]
MAKHHPYELILEIIKQAEAGATNRELSLEHGINKNIISEWRVKYKGMDLAMMEDRKSRIRERIANTNKEKAERLPEESKKEKLENIQRHRSYNFLSIPQAVQDVIQEWASLKNNGVTRVQMNETRLKIIQCLAKAWGGECLSAEYKTHLNYMSIRCAKGHDFEIKPRRLIYGSFCPICYKDEEASLKTLQDLAAARGWQSLATEYKNCKTPVAWRCDQGHEFNTSLDSIKNGVGCMQCHKDRYWFTLEKMQGIAKQRDGLCLSDQYTPYDPMLWQCKRGHTWKALSTEICKGHWCQQCSFIDKITNPKSKAWGKYQASKLHR